MQPALTMRKYQRIWERLKEEGSADVHAPVESHRQIVLAVRKEKTYDYGWKLQCSEHHSRYKLHDYSDGKVIHFSLKQVPYLSLARLTVGDL